jgi:dihydrodipicolinate synthase/N-acetylneuraminate lyase
MIAPIAVSQTRHALLQRLFPDGVPPLWCPLLTHYDSERRMDHGRILAHLRHLSPHVKGFLIPGSTGDGWELSESESGQLIEIALDAVHELGLYLLIGVLKAEAADAVTSISQIISRIKSRTGQKETEAALERARVSGFTVCAPRGKERTQKEIQDGLEHVLEIGVPVAIYQLPQVTQNEISPEVAANLASRFPNFTMLKDTSGKDHISLSGKDLAGVFTVRGAEGDYARWPLRAGGPYNGFLLSTANCFAKQLDRMLADISAGRMDAAASVSERLTTVISEAFQLASPLPDGNPYANANKAMDHFFAHGREALSRTPPRLHAGSHLPRELLQKIGDLLSRHDLLPDRGYL